MTEGRSPVDAAAARRRLVLAAETPTLPYSTSHAAVEDDTASEDGPSGRARDPGQVDLGVLLEDAEVAAARLGDVPAETIHPGGLADALTQLRRVRNRLEAVETAWLSQVRNRKVHRDHGASSASKWAAQRLGGSQRDAADQIRTADRIADLPDTAGAFGDGHITREAASAIGRAMQDDRLRGLDDAEARLLAAAKRGGADQVRRTAREMTAAADVERAEADAAAQRARRYANVHRRSDGMLKIDALLDQDNGEAFYTAYQALFNPARPDNHPNGHTGGGGGDGSDGRTVRQRAADTLGEMGRRLLDPGGLPDTAGQATTVLVTIPEAALHGDLDHGTPRMRFTGPIPPSTARRHACDAGIVPVVLNGASVPVDIGRTSRQPTTAQRRCLAVRDRACRMCGASDRPLVAHHCTHWADGGPTDLHNLILLCWSCHQLVHEGRWHAAWQPDNSVIFTHPDGRRLIRPPPA